MGKEILGNFLKRSPPTITKTSDYLLSNSPPHKSTDSKERPNKIMACLIKIRSRIREKMGTVDETQSPARVDYTLPNNPKSLSIPSETTLTTQISDPITSAMGLESTESSTAQLTSPRNRVGQKSLTHSTSATISRKQVEEVSQQNWVPEDGNNRAPPTTEKRRASGIISLNTFNKKDREEIGEIMQEIDHRDHRGLEVGRTLMLPHGTSLSSLGAQQVDARYPQRHGTGPGNIRQRLETGTELGVPSLRPNKARPSSPSSSLEPLSRQNSSTSSTQSAELDTLLDIGLIDKNGKKQWRILSLDTNSDVNIVALIVVDKLELTDQIKEYNGKDIKGLGRCAHVKPVGQIELTFSVVGGRKSFTNTFLVLCNEDADEFDAIGGLPLVKKEKWLRPGKPGAFMALSR